MALFNLPPQLRFIKNEIKIPKYEGITMPIEYAFTIGGTRYFRFTEVFNTPPVRALKSATFYEECNMKCSLEFLEKQNKARDVIWSKGVAQVSTKDLTALYNMDMQLKERVAWKMPELNLCYKLASIIFFDDNESPVDYDFKYNAKKIERWKKEADATDFFMQLPVRSLMPFINVPEESFATYSQIVEDMNNLQWDYLDTIISQALTISNSSSSQTLQTAIKPN